MIPEHFGLAYPAMRLGSLAANRRATVVCRAYEMVRLAMDRGIHWREPSGVPKKG